MRRLGAAPRARARATAAALVAALAAAPAAAPAADPPAPAVAVIIDDVGYLRGPGLRALELPGAVSYAFLPRTPHARALARLAFELGKDVMLHLPMEARSGKRLGPGGITAGMGREALQATLRAGLEAIPHARGVSNHMGSLLTPRRRPMTWLMEAIGRRGDLFFVDSHTIPESVAVDVALEQGVPAARRDVFLDHRREPAEIRRQFERLVALARARGNAIGIGHPHPETLEVLAELLPGLARRGVRLVGVSAVVRMREAARDRLELASRGSP